MATISEGGDMRKQEPAIRTINASAARQQWSELLNKVFRRETRVVVEKSGIPVAAIIAADDLQRLMRLEAERAEDFKILEEIGTAFKEVAPEEMERAVDRAVAEARAENRRRAAPPA